MSSSLVSVKAVQAGLGPISMADVDMAVGMEGSILGFNVKNSNNAVTTQAKQKGVAILRNNVIYHVIQEVRHFCSACLLEPISCLLGCNCELQGFNATLTGCHSQAITFVCHDCQ